MQFGSYDTAEDIPIQTIDQLIHLVLKPLGRRTHGVVFTGTPSTMEKQHVNAWGIGLPFDSHTTIYVRIYPKGSVTKYIAERPSACPGPSIVAVRVCTYRQVCRLGIALLLPVEHTSAMGAEAFAERSRVIIPSSSGSHNPMNIYRMTQLAMQASSKAFRYDRSQLFTGGFGPSTRPRDDSIHALCHLSTFLALKILPITKDALLSGVDRETGLPLVLCLAIRLATEPTLFGLESTTLSLASIELRHRYLTGLSDVRGDRTTECPVLAIDLVFESAVNDVLRKVYHLPYEGRKLGPTFLKELPEPLVERIHTLAENGRELSNRFYGHTTHGKKSWDIDTYTPLLGNVACDPFAHARETRYRTEDDGPRFGPCPWPLSDVPPSERRDKVVELFTKLELLERVAYTRDLRATNTTGETPKTIFDGLVSECVSHSESEWRDEESQCAIQTNLRRYYAGTDPSVISAPCIDGLTDQYEEALLINLLGWGPRLMGDGIGTVSFVVHPDEPLQCPICNVRIEGLELILPLPNGRCGECARPVCIDCIDSMFIPDQNMPIRCRECDICISQTRHAANGS